VFLCYVYVVLYVLINSVELCEKATLWNEENKKVGRVVLFSVHEQSEKCTQLNIAVYANTDEEAEGILKVFCGDGGSEGRD